MSPNVCLRCQDAALGTDVPAKTLAFLGLFLTGDFSEARHVPALDGIRGLAILLVLVLHFRVPALLGSPVGQVYDRIARAGWVGVDLFFVLSGFLITGILLDTKNDPHYLGNFFARRALRILPISYGLLFFSYVLLPRLHSFRWPDYTSAVAHQAWFWLYGTNILIALHGSWSVAAGISHFWSLAVEEQFYLVWPAVIWFTPRASIRRVCVGLILGAPIIRLTLCSTGTNPLANYVLMPTRVDALAIGALIATLLRDPSSLDSLVRWAPRLAIATALVWIALFVSLGGWSETNRTVQTVGYSIQDMFFGAILVVTVGVSGRSRLSHLFETRTLRMFGRYSYAMYVLHPLLGAYAAQKLLQHPLPALTDFERQLVVVLVAVAFTTAVAALSWRAYEQPFLHLKRHFCYKDIREIVPNPSPAILAPVGSGS